jgi:hypothetical protein
MTDTIEVGRRYRNSTGEYELLSIDGMWATVRYENGETKRHLLAALQIHWENDRSSAEAAATAAQKAAKTPRVRAAKPAAPFPIEETTPLVAGLIRELAAANGNGAPVGRQAIVEALLANPQGRQLIEATHKGLFYRSEEWIAGSIIDQFAKDLSRKGSPVYHQFDREQIDNVWAYKPK